jgi:isopentenyl phosphate kinase
MKTPKLKAKELVEKYTLLVPVEFGGMHIDLAKQCAIISVNEIFEHIDYIFTELEKDKLPNKFDDEIEYWNKVKKEIELL